MISVYLGYLIFQLVSHKELYSDDTILPSDKYSDATKMSVKKWVMWLPRARREAKEQRRRAKTAGSQLESQPSVHSEHIEEPEQPKLSVWMTVALLVTVTVVSMRRFLSTTKLTR